MEKNREAETSTPVATVEDIQKRLIRPSLQWRDRINSQVSSKINANSHALLKKKAQATRIHKLEDYLHPALLSTAQAKISGNRKKYHGVETKTARRCAVHEFDLFRWSGDGDHHQHRFSALAGGSTAGISEVKEEDGNDAVDLSKD